MYSRVTYEEESVMKRRYVLFVPVAAVTLWLNGVSGNTSVNAAGIQNAPQQPALVYQDAERDQNGQPAVAPQNEKKTTVAAKAKKEKQQFQATENKDNKAPQAYKAEKKTTVDQATKEKRKQALAADYKTRQQNGEYGGLYN